jgi:hypothetical protein
MKMMKISQSSELLSKHDFAFQHRLWIIQHCGLAITAAFMVAALLGIFNLGPFSKASVHTTSELLLNEDSSMGDNTLTHFYHPIRSPERDTNETHEQ